LDAELVANAWLDADTVAEGRERLHRALAARSEPGLWNVLAAWEAICTARPASEPLALLAPVLPDLSREEDSLLATVARLALVSCGELDEARARCDALIDVARPRGWLIALAHGSLCRAMALVQAGLVREAEVDARLAFSFKLANSPLPALLWSLFSLVDARVELDEPEQAAAALDRVGLLTGTLPSGALATPRVLASRAGLRLVQHRPADAHADLVAAAEAWRALDVSHPALAAWRVADCEALTVLGDPDEARRLAEAHLELAERVELPGPRGAGLRALALTVDRPAAVGLLRQAVDVLADAPDQLEHVRVLVDLGAALRRSNQRAEAREQLGRALGCAERFGLRRLALRAQVELRAAGARPRRTAVSGLAALTPAEHRVATLAAEGESNREIAQQLYVSRRTVETHLTHVFQKLGLATRADLGVLLSGRAGAGA
jgi:DNA-binding CsgD family transcriptional regulator